MTRTQNLTCTALAMLLASASACTSSKDASGGDAGADTGGNLPDAGRPFTPKGPISQAPDLSTMVAIPGGTFQMGRVYEKAGGYGQPWKENEMPAHNVTVDGFRIDKDEVTVAEYATYLTAAGGPSHWHPLMPILRTADGGFAPSPGMEKRPASFVSWFDAVTFCAWNGKRLPTEAQWERAARGPMNTTYPWGETGPSCEHAIHFTRGAFCANTPQDVGGRSPKGDSAEGLHDMAGNVAEWVWDTYGNYQADDATNPSGPAPGKYRVVRGGGYREQAPELRSLARWAARPEQKSEGVGFRCVVKP